MAKSARSKRIKKNRAAQREKLKKWELQRLAKVAQNAQEIANATAGDLKAAAPAQTEPQQDQSTTSSMDVEPAKNSLKRVKSSISDRKQKKRKVSRARKEALRRKHAKNTNLRSPMDVGNS